MIFLDCRFIDKHTKGDLLEVILDNQISVNDGMTLEENQ